LISQVLLEAHSQPVFSRVASACPLVFRHAASDPLAQRIMQQAARSLVDTLENLLFSCKKIHQSDMILAAGGSVMGQTGYQTLLLEMLASRGMRFLRLVHVRPDSRCT